MILGRRLLRLVLGIESSCDDTGAAVLRPVPFPPQELLLQFRGPWTGVMARSSGRLWHHRPGHGTIVSTHTHAVSRKPAIDCFPRLHEGDRRS